ncbi:hypothetical protein C0J52_22662 [Blattella germanica]|nr:hypothetical protein C0J52_22662 [Blattella germanica]
MTTFEADGRNVFVIFCKMELCCNKFIEDNRFQLNIFQFLKSIKCISNEYGCLNYKGLKMIKRVETEERNSYDDLDCAVDHVIYFSCKHVLYNRVEDDFSIANNENQQSLKSCM